MEKAVFFQLIRWTKDNTGLQPTRYRSAEQKVLIILYILAHGATQCLAAHKFGVTQSSISKLFEEILPMLVALYRPSLPNPLTTDLIQTMSWTPTTTLPTAALEPLVQPTSKPSFQRWSRSIGSIGRAMSPRMSLPP